MQKISIATENDRGFIQICGPQAEKFLQGQVTCDVRAVKDNGSIIGAHCNLKGRILFTFRLFFQTLSPALVPPAGEGNVVLRSSPLPIHQQTVAEGGKIPDKDAFLLCLPKTQVEYAITALKKYAMFSKVTIEDVSDQLNSLDFLPADWKLTDIKSGIAEIYPETREQFTPHEINYHELGGVSFDKGCYTGQEIVARMHYLGKLKTKMQLIQQSTPPQRGAKMLSSEGESIGYIVDFAENNETEYLILAVLTRKSAE